MNQIATLERPLTPIRAGRVDTSRGSTIMDASMNWMRRPADEKFLDLDTMHAAAHASHLSSVQKVVDVKNVELLPADEIRTRDDFNKLTVVVKGSPDPLNFSHWSFGQMAGLAGAPASYLRTLPPLLHRSRYDAEYWVGHGNPKVAVRPSRQPHQSRGDAVFVARLAACGHWPHLRAYPEP